jgi:hypothetical protein
MRFGLNFCYDGLRNVWAQNDNSSRTQVQHGIALLTRGIVNRNDLAPCSMPLNLDTRVYTL